MVSFVALHVVSCLKGHKMGVLWWASWVYVAYADWYFGFRPDLIFRFASMMRRGGWGDFKGQFCDFIHICIREPFKSI